MFMLAPLTPEKLLFYIFKSTNNAVSSDYERKEFLFTDELFLVITCASSFKVQMKT